MSRYYLVVDSGTQWFRAIIETHEDSNRVIQQKDLPSMVEGTPFVSNVFYREVHFRYQKFDGINSNLCPCYGWTISKFEYDRISQLIDLSYYVQKFNELKK